MSTATITARSRNLGISWSNEPERIWNADCSKDEGYIGRARNH